MPEKASLRERYLQHIGIFARACCGMYRGIHFINQPLTVAGVGADHRAGGADRIKERLLGAEILFHVAVIIQVILGEVREYASSEADCVYPLLSQPVRRDFHDYAFACFSSLMQLDLKRQSVKGGETARQSAQRAHRSACLFQNRCQHGRYCGLAVGAGDADNICSLRRMPMQSRCHSGHRASHIGCDRFRHS